MSASAFDVVHIDRRYDWERTTPSVAIAEALAGVESATGSELVTALDTTLYDNVETEALDALVTGADDVVEFTVGSYRIRIDGDRLVVGDDGTSPDRT